MCYLVAKDRNAHGCFALKTTHGKHLVELKRELNKEVGYKGVQLVTISRPTAYWLYVEDHCKAIDLIIHKGRVGEVYNVGGHNEKQNIEIVKIICKELGKPESLITHVGDRKGHDMRYAIDPTKIHNELGWLPETKFEDGIKKTIQNTEFLLLYNYEFLHAVSF